MLRPRLVLGSVRFLLLALGAAACGGTSAPAPRPHAAGDALPPWFGLPGAPPQTIQGTLFDGAVPASGTVRLRLDGPDPSVWTGLEQSVGPDGRFRFGPVRAGRYRLFAHRPDASSRIIDVDIRASSADTQLFLHPCDDVDGRIETELGKPLPGAVIDMDGFELGTADADGRYLVCPAHDGDWLWRRAPGWIGERVAQWDADRPSPMRRPQVIRGRVVDRAGHPMADVGVQPVVAHHPTWTGGPVRAVATTDREGRFELPWPPPDGAASPGQGPPRVSFHVHRGDQIARFAGRGAIDAETLISVDSFEPALPVPAEPATLRGRLRMAGVPMIDTRVGFERDGATATTDAQGRFVLPAPRRRFGLLKLEVPDRFTLTRPYRFASNETPGELDIDLGAPADLSITLSASSLLRSVIGVARETGAEVHAVERQRGFLTLYGEAGSTYDLYIKRGREPREATGVAMRLPSTEPVQLAANPVEVSGVVVDDRGRPRANADVTADGWNQRVVTDAQGRFTLTLDGAGPFDLRATGAGEVGFAMDATPGTPSRITLAATGSLRVRCEGATIHEYAQISSAVLSDAVACESTAHRLPPGPYTLQLATADGGHATAVATVKRGETAEVIVRVAAARADLNVRVMEAPTGVPVAGMTCETGLRNRLGTFVGSGVGGSTDAAGQWKVATSIGAVIVRCQDPEQALVEGEAEVVVDADSQTAVDVHLVLPPLRGIDLGVTMRGTADGAQIIATSALAVKSGLRAGDRVLAVDGRSLAGLGAEAMKALAFYPEAGRPHVLTLRRAGKRRTVTLGPL